MKLTINGQEIDAAPVTFSSGGEMRTTLLCDNGEVLQVRVLVTEVFALTGMRDPFGRQAYGVNYHAIVTPAPKAPEQSEAG